MLRSPPSRFWRWSAYALFVGLILLGIAMKRVASHPEWLPPLHISALIVLIGITLTGERDAAQKGEPEAGDPEEPRSWDEV